MKLERKVRLCSAAAAVLIAAICLLYTSDAADEL